MVSYKNLYIKIKKEFEEYKKEQSYEYELDWKCPLCDSILLTNDSEIYCKDEKGNCTYNPIISELIERFFEMKQYERVD